MLRYHVKINIWSNEVFELTAQSSSQNECWKEWQQKTYERNEKSCWAINVFFNMYISLCVAVSLTRLLEAIVSDWIMKLKNATRRRRENRKIANIDCVHIRDRVSEKITISKAIFYDNRTFKWFYFRQYSK